MTDDDRPSRPLRALAHRAVVRAAAAALALACASARADAPERAVAVAEGDAVGIVAGAAPALDPAALEPAALADASARARGRVVAAARRRLGRPFRGDCSGFVLAALADAGVSPALRPARSRSESLYLATRHVRSPRPGDLAFFDDTYDRNHDGIANDRFTHVALVETVRGPAITLLHRGAHGVERIRIDLARPSDPEANDPVRWLRRGEDPRTRVLAGELLTAWGAVVPLNAGSSRVRDSRSTRSRGSR